jgi:hypothetical protein
MFKKILYIGSGDDLTPLNYFTSSQFVYIDSLPRNSYGYPYYYREFYNKQFKQIVMTELYKLDFHKLDEKKFSNNYSEINVVDLDSHIVTFKREREDIQQTLNYYFSTGIPENLYNGNNGKGYLNEDLCKDISECDTILIKGHLPHKDIVEHIKNPIHFIGSESTYFPERENETEFENYSYLYNPDLISSYSYLSKLGELTIFQTYTEFYNHIIKKNQE